MHGTARHNLVIFRAMFSPIAPQTAPAGSFELLDRAAIGYVCLPLVIFLAGWFEWWAALPLIACTAYALRSLIAKWPRGPSRLPITPLQLAVAVIVGGAWTVLGGTDHLVFANADWHIRDAVLHDLVVSPWPVGYGLVDGQESLLRAPVAYYLPAAIVGKAAGLAAAHVSMLVWTAIGAILFLLQVLSLTRSRWSVAVTVAAVVVFFSGFDIIGSLLNDGPHFRSDWNITTHLEWWAGSYQYSSMTTQLFWVPNHALGGWLLIGLLYRDDRSTRLDSILPMLFVASALWSPLTAIGLIPFVAWKWVSSMRAERSWRLLHPQVWLPALVVGVALVTFLALDPGRIPKGFALAKDSPGGAVMSLLRQAQFFLLEAGILGIAILAIRRRSEVVVALVVLAVLPFAYLGGGNDLVMRASIPSLAVLTIAAGLALVADATEPHATRKKIILAGLLAVGAVTPIEELARAVILPVWPINTRATLIGASCGAYAPHYVARLSSAAIAPLLRPPNQLSLGPLDRAACFNPAIELMWRGHPL